MRVLQINSVCGIRSTGRICTDIAAVLERHGYDCKIAFGRETVPAQHQKYAHRIATPWDNRIDALKSRIFDNTGFNSERITKRFIRWMREYDPDIIHLHNIHGYYVNVEALFQALKEMDKPVIWTLHDCWSFTGHCSHFELIGCQKWRAGCYRCPKVHAYPKSWFLDHSGKSYARKKACFTGVKNLTIVTPSRWLADLVKQSFLKEYDVQVIPNGIDLNVFQPMPGTFREDYHLNGKKIVLAVASAWGRSKGLDDLFKLADMLGDGYRVVIVGLKPEQMRRLPENVTGIERTNHVRQLAQIYTAADIFVNPTYQDTYPTVNLEAQACGTPVITYRSGGSSESVPPEQVVERGDLEGLCRAVRQSETCKVADADFSARSCFQKYLELYQRKADLC